MDKEQRSSYKTEIVSAIIVILLTGFTIIYCHITSDRPQVFTDVIEELTSRHAGNKTAERNLFYILSVIGAILFSAVYIFSPKIPDKKTCKEFAKDRSYYLLTGLVVLAGIEFFIYSTVNWLLLSALLVGMIMSIIDRSAITESLGFFLICIYALCGLYRLYVFCGGGRNLSLMTVGLFALIFSLIIICLGKGKKEAFIRGILTVQLFIPFLLLIFLASHYSYEGVDIVIEVPFRIRIFIYLVMIIMGVEALLIMKRFFLDKTAGIGNVISYGTCISIMSFNCFSGNGAILSADYHHPFENIIGYSQIFELNRNAFSQYIPVSGMYSVLCGAMLSLFGKGRFAYYSVTQDLFYLFIAVIIVVILKKTLKNPEWLLFLSVLYRILDYNRVALILPLMLLLSYPKLIEKKNAWLLTWVITSLLHGLYYPLFGAAICIGFMPLAFYQAFTYAKSGGLKTDIRKKSFWLGWIGCLIAVIISVPWLLGLFGHIKAMGEQTITADGLTRFSQVIPEYFIGYSESLSLRLLLYYVLSYILPASIVWVSVVMGLETGKVHLAKKHFNIEKTVPALLCISSGLAALVCFSFTTVRLDVGSIYARSEGIIFAACIMFIVFADRYLEDGKKPLLLVIYTMILIGAVSGEGFRSMGSDSKLNSEYSVGEEYKRVTESPETRFGDCFVPDDGSFDETIAFMEGLDKDRSYFAAAKDFGYYYLCNMKGDGPIEAVTVKGYDAAVETADVLKKNGTFVGTAVDSLQNYYLYHWLIESGDYIWDDGEKLFRPNTDNVPRDEVLEANRSCDIARDDILLIRSASSWGASMDSLQSVFSKADVDNSLEYIDDKCNINLASPIDGDEADYMYLEFEDDLGDYDYRLFNLGHSLTQDVESHPFNMYVLKKDYNPGKNVEIIWKDDYGTDHSMTCYLGRGKLLIPLGSGRGWLLNSHGEITVSLKDDENKALSLPDIKEVDFLKLREL